MDINEKQGRLAYLENRVKEMRGQIAGYEETLRSNECIMAALVKKAGGELMLTQEEIKEATEAGSKIIYHWDAEKRTFTFTVNE